MNVFCAMFGLVWAFNNEWWLPISPRQSRSSQPQVGTRRDVGVWVEVWKCQPCQGCASVRLSSFCILYLSSFALICCFQWLLTKLILICNNNKARLQARSAAAAASVRKTTFGFRRRWLRTPPFTCFFFGGGRDSWSLVGRGLQPYYRNQQKSHALHSRSAGKLRSCINVFQWQFSVSTQCALPTLSQFPSPHRNHSGHTFLLLLVLRPWEWSTRHWKIIVINRTTTAISLVQLCNTLCCTTVCRPLWVWSQSRSPLESGFLAPSRS